MSVFYLDVKIKSIKKTAKQETFFLKTRNQNGGGDRAEFLSFQHFFVLFLCGNFFRMELDNTAFFLGILGDFLGMMDEAFRRLKWGVFFIFLPTLQKSIASTWIISAHEKTRQFNWLQPNPNSARRNVGRHERRKMSRPSRWCLTRKCARTFSSDSKSMSRKREKKTLSPQG